MARIDPLASAVTAYVSARWDANDWRHFGRETGTGDILRNHPRLYRSLDFNDPDYPDAAADVMERVLREAIEAGSGEKGRMDFIAEWMPDLPAWLAENAAYRTKKLFDSYLAARTFTEIPSEWVSSHDVDTEPADDLEEDPAELPAVPSAAVASPPAPGTIAADDTEEETVSIAAAHARTPNPSEIFIVHGHDEAARDSIRIYVHELTGIVPTSLAEKPGRGDTIIEKFEKVAGEAAYVIVLLTPDDVGNTVGEHDAGSLPNPRARQNVVLELGYFIGKIGRANVVVLDADVERPSDLAGLSYVKYPGLNWKDELRKELKESGLTL